MQAQANRRMTLQGILHRGRNVFLVDQDHKTLLSLGEPSVLLGGAEENWRCLASYDLDVSFTLGESRGSLVSLSVSGGGRIGGVFFAADQDEILESGSMPNRCDAGSSSLLELVVLSIWANLPVPNW